jgi:hypothetical protein
MRILPTCDLCEEPFKDDTDRHVMRTDTAELTIHKACAMQLFKGVWDRQEELAAKGLLTGGMHSETVTTTCLVCHDQVWDGPVVKLDGLSFLVHDGCYSQYQYGDAPMLSHKGMMAKAGQASSTTYIDEDYMRDYDQLQAEYDVALSGIVKKHKENK